MLLGVVIAVVQMRLVTASIDTGTVLNSFRPESAFGGCIDGQDKGDVARSFLPENVKLMRTAGLRSLSYRLRTELACEAFHWNPRGTWSDPARQCGYWISNKESPSPILEAYGYRLPRRGDTIDQANNDGYSRLDDGSLNTFWKSNPYLDPAYSKDLESEHPQWVLVDLGHPAKVNTLIIYWAEPYAVRYRVEFWLGDNNQKGADADGSWEPACRLNDHGRGGTETVALECRARVRFIRLCLLKSSHTAPPTDYPDPRDSMGFAIREIELGRTHHGRFQDEIVHCQSNSQTVFYTSSTDPWHSASDMDPNVEQPGFDLMSQSGLTNGQPVLVPVPALYDTPENAAAEISYLKSRGVKLRGIEIGEEPDGQCVTAEDYACLYTQFARAIRKVEPEVPIGGPSFQSTELDYLAWPEGPSTGLWITKCLAFLHAHKAADLFQFLSFEWYPFDEIRGDPERQLQEAPLLLRDALQRLIEGAGAQIPRVLSEYGYSAFAAPQEVDLPGAILNLDSVGEFLEMGGDAAYLYGYVANTPIAERYGLYGNLMMFEADKSGAARFKLPTYYAARMMTEDWCSDESSLHSLVRVSLSGRENKKLSAYAVRRPDGKSALLVLNKSKDSSCQLRIEQNGRPWNEVQAVQYSPKNYKWLAEEENSRPDFSDPPERFAQRGSLTLPPFSITVVTPGGSHPSSREAGTN